MMAVEKERGCGYRTVGSMYLVGAGRGRPCDLMPLELRPCSRCGYEPKFNRGFTWLQKGYIEALAYEHKDFLKLFDKTCECPADCPICFPEHNPLEKYGLMWVGEKHYTPDSFASEAAEMGVSKKIPMVPKDLTLQTWILLAHPRVTFPTAHNDNGYAQKAGIFYAFKPVRIEKLIWKSQATKETLQKLEKRNITPVIIPDGDEDHAPKREVIA